MKRGLQAIALGLAVIATMSLGGRILNLAAGRSTGRVSPTSPGSVHRTGGRRTHHARRPKPQASPSTRFPFGGHASRDSLLKPLQAIANSIVGPVHARGADLIDARGHTFRLTSVNYLPLKNTNAKPFDAGSPWDYDNIASMGFNSVRLGITWGHLEPTAPTIGPDGTIEHHYDQGYLHDMDTIVNGLTGRGLAVIISLQQFGWFPMMPAWLDAPGISADQARCDFFSNRSDSVGVQMAPWSGTLALWQALAGRYRRDPQVLGFDVFNEPRYPQSCSTANLFDFYRAMGTGIRTVNPDLLLVLEDFGPGSADRGVFASNQPPPFPNAVYSFHVYKPDWSSFEPTAAAYVGHAGPWNVPMWMGEFNAFNADSVASGIPFRDRNWRGDTQALMAYLRGRNVGWAYFSYSGLDSLFLATGAPNLPLIKALAGGFDDYPKGRRVLYGIPNPFGTCTQPACNVFPSPTPGGTGGLSGR